MAASSGGGPVVRCVVADELGYVRAAQAAGPDASALEAMQLVARWGDGQRARGVERLTLSDGDDGSVRGLLAVARTCGEAEALDPLSGASFGVIGSGFGPCRGLHLVAPHAGAEGHRLLSCTQAGLLRVHAQESAEPSAPWSLAGEWRVSGNVASMAALAGGGRVALGGDGADVALYDGATGALLVKAKPPAKDWLGMYRKIYVASLSFLGSGSAPECVLAGGEAELRLFDFRAQRRAVRCMPLGEGAVGALAVSADGSCAAGGTTRGQLAHFDLGTGKLLGAFKGCSGAVRSLSLHPSLPLLAATGLDRHVRVFSTRTRREAASLFIKQPATAVAWDWRSADALAPPPVQPPEPEPAAPRRRGAAAAPAEEEAPVVAPRKRKHKRTSAVIDGFARDSQRARAGEDALDAEAVAAAAALRERKLKKQQKKQRALEAGLQLNIEA